MERKSRQEYHQVLWGDQGSLYSQGERHQQAFPEQCQPEVGRQRSQLFGELREKSEEWEESFERFSSERRGNGKCRRRKEASLYPTFLLFLSFLLLKFALEGLESVCSLGKGKDEKDN